MQTPRITMPKLLIALTVALAASAMGVQAAPIVVSGTYTVSETPLTGNTASEYAKIPITMDGTPFSKSVV